MKRKAFYSMLVAGCWLAVSLALPAQNSANQSRSSDNAKQSTSSSASADQRAVTLLNTANQGEIDMGNLMKDKAQNQQVKDFANTLVTDHQQAQDKLKDIASKDNLNLDTNQKMQQEEQSFKDRLQNTSGARADRMFVRHEALDHQKVIGRLETLKSKVKDSDLRAYIDQTLPTLRKHLTEARHLESGRSSSASSTPASSTQRPY